MVNPVMSYAWGSRDGIATLQGRPPASQPEAELWMGAHPQAASALEGPTGNESLDTFIAADPVAILGSAVVARFGSRLPFMVKVLSAAQPLSLQVHPEATLAKERCALEDFAGIDRAAPTRSYRDPYAKPEMLLAITDFEALLGFRPAAEAADWLAALGVPRLTRIVETLRAGKPTGEVFLSIVEWPLEQRADLVADVRAAISASDDENAGWLASLADRYPTDPGVIGAVLLNHVKLAPGQAIYVEPGQIHAYLHGTGVEILGGSDNVVRGGLTRKHVALDELRRLLAVEATRPRIIDPVRQADGEERWPTPRPEFALSRLRLDGASRVCIVCGPEILLCLEGQVEVRAVAASLVLAVGESAFVTADTGPTTLVGRGVILRATPGLTPGLTTDDASTRSEA
jgi:mannose-6-phosphate isomerase